MVVDVSTVCSVEGCGQECKVKGLCQRHYNQVKARRRRANKGDEINARRRERYTERKEIVLEANRQWRRKNPDNNKGVSSRWRKENPEAAAKMRNRANGKRRSVRSLVDPRGVLGASHLREMPCACCGKPGPSAVDHILPLCWAKDCLIVRESLAESWCYQPLCKSCNSSKGHREVWCFVPTGDIDDV